MLFIKKQNIKFIFSFLFFSLIFFSCKDNFTELNGPITMGKSQINQKLLSPKNSLAISSNFKEKLSAFYLLNSNMAMRINYDQISKEKIFAEIKNKDNFSTFDERKSFLLIKQLYSLKTDKEVEGFINFYTKLRNELIDDIKIINFNIKSIGEITKNAEFYVANSKNRNAKTGELIDYSWLLLDDENLSPACRKAFYECVNAAIVDAFAEDVVGGTIGGVVAGALFGPGAILGGAAGFITGSTVALVKTAYEYAYGGCARGYSACKLAQAPKPAQGSSAGGCEYPLLPRWEDKI